MLGKLLKYDIKRELKSLIPIYGVILVLPIVIRLMDLIVDKVPLFATIGGIVMVLYVIALIGTFFYTFFNSIKNFTSNVLKDEGYLTHTLPIKRSNIIISKEITAMITIVISVIAIIISLLLAFYDGTPISDLLFVITDTVEKVAPMYGMGLNEFYAFWLVLLIVSYLGYITVFHLALILGHTRNTNRIVFSIVFGIIIYLVMQILSMIGLGIDILLKPELLEDMTNGSVNMLDVASTMSLILWTQGIIAIVTPVATHFISCIIINKKLNLE